MAGEGEEGAAGGGAEGGDGGGADVEARAKEMGWIPKEQFRGDEGKWIDAATFVERGENLLPIIQATNRKLYGKVATLESQLAQATTAIQTSQETIAALKEFNDDMARQRAKQRKIELRTEINAAREAEDPEKEQELLEELGEVTTALKAAEKAPRGAARPNGQPQQRQQQQQQAPDPVLQAWMQDNPWVGQDEQRTDLATVVAQRMRRNPENAGLTGRAFLDKVAEEVESILPRGARRNGHDRVEGGARSSGANPGGGKTYADLPREVKEVCDRQGKKLIGAGRAFPDEKAWRQHYCNQYFKE